MKKILLAFATFFAVSSAYAAPVTTAEEQKSLVDALSGVSYLGVGGLPNVISQRFSDSAEIFTSAQYLKTKYEEAGIAARVMEYDPMDAFPYYFQNTDETYRSYFRHLTPMLKSEFDGYCAGTLSPEKKEAVLNRLARVGMEPGILCGHSSENRVEMYIRATIAHTTEITRVMLRQRTLATWPNVVAYVPTAEAQAGEFGPRPLCVIGAHMDSVARDGGGRGPIVSPGTLAPGADDNGSGTAAIFTLARAVKNWVRQTQPVLPCDLAFVHFSGEEEGLLGSLAFTRLQNSRPVLWMVNFDMIAYNSSEAPAPAMNVGYDKRFGSALADTFAGDVEQLKTVIVERDTFIYSSDQIAFWTMGVPAVSISEQACSNSECSDPFKFFNPKLHTPEDKSAILDFSYAARIVNKSYDGLLKLLVSGKFR